MTQPLTTASTDIASSDLRALRRAEGERLKALRQAAGLTQRVLADRIGLTHYTFLAQIEAGRAPVPKDRVAAFAAALGLTEGEFIRILAGSPAVVSDASVVLMPQVQQIGHKCLEGGGRGC